MTSPPRRWRAPTAERTRTLREATVLTLTHGAGLVLGLVTALVFTRSATPATYADFGYAVSVLALASLASLPGFATAVTHAAAKGHDGALAAATRLRLRGSLVGTAALAVLAIVLWRAGRHATAIVIAGCAVLLPLLHPCSGVLSYLIGKRRLLTYAAADLTVESAKTAAVVIAVLLLGWNGPKAVLAPFAVTGIGYLALTLLFTPRGRADAGGTATAGPELGALGTRLTAAAVLATAAAQLDRLLLGTFFEPRLMAAYTLAFSLTDPLRGFGTIANRLLMPRLITLDTRSAAFRRRFGFGLAVLAAALAAMVGAFWGIFPLLQPVLFPGYEDAVAMARWLVVAAALTIFATVCTLTLWGVGSLRPISVTQIVSPLLRVALLLGGAALWGVRGILVSQVAHQVVVIVVVLAWWSRESRRSTP